jgi:hypothetical protein
MYSAYSSPERQYPVEAAPDGTVHLRARLFVDPGCPCQRDLPADYDRAITWEARRRLAEPEPTNGLTVIVVASFGIAVNGLTGWLFASGPRRPQHQGCVPAHGSRRGHLGWSRCGRAGDLDDELDVA